MIEKLTMPPTLNHQAVQVGVSIGIATCFGDKTLTRDMLMERADEAMYRAKAAPQSDYQFYDAQDQDSAAIRV